VRDEFLDRGYVCVAGAFASDDAAAMRDEVWRELARRGISRSDRSTWTEEAPWHLQGLKSASAFAAIGGPPLTSALTDVLGSFVAPKDWGALFLLFPVPGAVPNVPLGTWHVDALYSTPVSPPVGARVLALFGDVAPGGGGTAVVAGSHRVLAAFAATQPADVLAKNARARRALMRSHPWLASLSRPGDPSSRIQRFMCDGDEIFGVRVRVVELCGSAGDVFLLHPGVLHARPVNAVDAPRFMTSKFVHSADAGVRSSVQKSSQD
jgi:hypothetical protein